MSRKLFVLLAVFALLSFAVAQKKNDHDADDRAAKAGKANSAKAVKITKGPVIEEVTDHSAIVAWSTNERASGVIRYGTQDGQLGQTAQAPYGGPTHRVHLQNLKPNTKYFFVVDSGQAQGSGTEAKSQEQSFTTVNKGQKHETNAKPGPGM
jgi:phosphodiesterase/alkaline phosphatase D-like protein